MDNSTIAATVAEAKRSARRVVRKRRGELATRRDSHPVQPRIADASSLSVRRLSAIGGQREDAVLIAEGDSWFDYPWSDVLSSLEDHYGYDIEEVAHRGDTIEDMAFADGQLVKFVRKIEKVLRRGEVPKAILLSGGGNDIAGDGLHMLLNHKASTTNGLNESVVEGILDQRIIVAYARILTRVAEVCEHIIGQSVPVIIHGYDYAVPDGRGFLGGFGPLPGPWLKPGFDRRGYKSLKERKRIIRTLIDRFNDRLFELTQTHPFDDYVYYVDLRRTLPTGNTYKDWWADELHPTQKGFRAVASKFHAMVELVV